MKQTARIISTYTGDTSGVCSALFELGGLVVMHDPSGCNSTYSTHDEPRWYDMDSLVFISGLTEKDAIFGNDEKVISDTVRAAEELNPRFIAIAGSPIPYLTGCDLNSIAMEIENRCGIPTFGFETDGMRSYVHGASMAFAEYTKRMCLTKDKKAEFSINILGVTPLDFSVNGSVTSMRNIFELNNINVNSIISMDSSINDIENAGCADINLVVSSTGIECAKILKDRFNIPYIIGTPFGSTFSKTIIESLKERRIDDSYDLIKNSSFDGNDLAIIGESITSLSLAAAIKKETGISAKVISAVDTPNMIRDHCINAIYEDEIIPHIKNCRNIIADPMYKPICPDSANFVDLPHEAFSGRIFRDQIPDLVGDIDFITSKLV